MKLAVSGASGKTGYRIAEEALADGHEIKLILRKNSEIPNSLEGINKVNLSLSNQEELDSALKGCDALIIATGARPSIDLTGPARVDALGVQKQVASCIRVGVKRLILVSSLCAGKFWHPLNLFGLILIWKRIGERSLENSGLHWTIIRPGGLLEREDNLSNENILYTGPNIQEDASIPRRLVARCCVEALTTPNSIQQIIEITSSTDIPEINMEKAIEGFKL